MENYILTNVSNHKSSARRQKNWGVSIRASTIVTIDGVYIEIYFRSGERATA